MPPSSTCCTPALTSARCWTRRSTPARKRRWRPGCRCSFPRCRCRLTSAITHSAWRSATLLKRHLLFANLIRLLKGRVIGLPELQQQMQGPLPESARAHIRLVLDALLALVAWALAPGGQGPLVTLRVQVWMRELRRMVGKVTSDPGTGGAAPRQRPQSPPRWCCIYPSFNAASAIPPAGCRAWHRPATSCPPAWTRSTTPGSAGAVRPCACILGPSGAGRTSPGCHSTCAAPVAICSPTRAAARPAAMTNWWRSFAPPARAAAPAATPRLPGTTAPARPAASATGRSCWEPAMPPWAPRWWRRAGPAPSMTTRN